MRTNLLNHVLRIWIGKNLLTFSLLVTKLLTFSLKQLKLNIIVTNQLNISKFVPLQTLKTLRTTI